MAKTIYLAEACHDEHNKAGYEGSKEGDQLQTVKEQANDFNGECRLSPWRDMKATMLIRYKNKALADNHAEIIKFFVNSKYVGYSQPNRLSLKNYVKSLGYANYKKIAKKKECDCSSLQCLGCNINGITDVKDWNTTAMLKSFPKLTQYFDIFTDEKYFRSSKYLENGDILVKDGHTACVVIEESSDEKKEEKKEEKKTTSSSSKSKILVGAKSKNTKFSGKYIAKTDVNLRYGPNSSTYDVIRVIKKNEIVTCYGYYTNDWYLVRTSKGETGFIKSTYLEKK